MKIVLIKIFVLVVLIFLVFGVGTWLYTAQVPPRTSDIAVRQVENNDEAYIQLREHEMVKNWITTTEVFVIVLISILLFWREIKIMVSKGKEIIQD